ncbi:nucleotide disphospho-sugar-binding domain-containing protein [Micromonospora sp. NPDC047793]|uniref:nucleotide disphospho-sugar-binding domain-containing protein n=1 Tax=unclassified Micromonospora TaxID=2617518 RepID=UPI00103382BE|nr:nucleotide disphospho-sugar-binding domain-containing protein [Verrucosispora sp. SN26_14.1]TBL45462.1 glycosyltransferase [Verrucosispora sp. SN26_14.1]
MRFLFTTGPLRGHLYPLVPLAWAARAAGHEVLVAAPDSFLPVVLESGLPATASGPAADFVDLVAVGESGGYGAAPTGVDAHRYRHGMAFGRLAAGALPGTRALVESWRPHLVVSERAEFAGPVAAAAAEVPSVTYHWGVATLSEYRSAAQVVLAPQLAALGLPGLPEPTEVLNPWPSAMRLPHAVGHQSIQDLAYNGTVRLVDWMFRDRTRPRVCVTFGTIAPRLRTSGAAMIVPLLRALEELGVELLVAGDPAAVTGWAGAESGTHWIGRLPLAQVLPGCDAVVNHGGHGSVLTALGAGCPQLILPQFDDQFDNAVAVSGTGAGLGLAPDKTSPELVAELISGLIEAPSYRQAAVEVAADIVAQPSPAEVVDLLAKLAV